MYSVLYILCLNFKRAPDINLKFVLTSSLDLNNLSSRCVDFHLICDRYVLLTLTKYRRQEYVDENICKLHIF